MYYIIILFSDGSMLVTPQRNFKRENYQEGSRFFKVHHDINIDQLSAWISLNYTSYKFEELS